MRTIQYSVVYKDFLKKLTDEQMNLIDETTLLSPRLKQVLELAT